MLSAEYVVGLVDEEGSFSVHVATPASSPKRRARVEPRFFLKLAERDAALLQELKEFFGCGAIYFQRDTRPNHQHCYRFEVQNRAEIVEKIIPFFEAHPLHSASKQKDFELFKEILRRVRTEQHFTKIGLVGIRALKIQMH